MTAVILAFNSKMYFSYEYGVNTETVIFGRTGSFKMAMQNKYTFGIEIILSHVAKHTLKTVS